MASFGSKLSAIKALQLELKNLKDEPVEGFNVMVSKEDNMFQWDVAIFGPPGTLYEGGYFKAIMEFPHDYPYSPPSITFRSKIWHPNVYDNGKLCISILHSPGEDAASGELACERWNPTQSVRTILLSVISLLNEPNVSSPANVDASVMFRKWRDGINNDYEHWVKNQVEESKKDAVKDGVTVPTKLEEYIAMQRQHQAAKSGNPQNLSHRKRNDEAEFDLMDDIDEDLVPTDDDDDDFGYMVDDD